MKGKFIIISVDICMVAYGKSWWESRHGWSGSGMGVSLSTDGKDSRRQWESQSSVSGAG